MEQQITVEQLKEITLMFWEQKKIVAAAKDVKTTEERKLSALQEEIVNMLEHLELKTFDAGVCKVSVSNKPYAKITDKVALTEFLKERGLYEDLVTFNAAKMNSFYNEEMEIAKSEMNLEFNIAGMEVSSNRRTLTARKGKQ